MENIYTKNKSASLDIETMFHSCVRTDTVSILKPC